MSVTQCHLFFSGCEEGEKSPPPPTAPFRNYPSQPLALAKAYHLFVPFIKINLLILAPAPAHSLQDACLCQTRQNSGEKGHTRMSYRGKLFAENGNALCACVFLAARDMMVE